MEKVLQHVKNKIQHAVIEEDIENYPYFTVRDIFPDDYYESLIKNFSLLDKSLFQPLSKNYKNRYTYDLMKGENNLGSSVNNFSDLSGSAQTFWKNFQKYFLRRNDLHNCFMEKYNNFIIFPPTEKIYTNCRLQKDNTGYQIGPHTDKVDKLYSTMFYTPHQTSLDEKTQIDHGTALLTPKDPNLKQTPFQLGHVGTGEDRHFLFEELEIIKTVAAIPNSLFSWAVTKDSWHGVTPIRTYTPRHTIAYFAKIPKNSTQFHELK